METVLIIFAAAVIIVFTVISYYTSVSSGAAKFEKWLMYWNEKLKK